MYRRFVYAALLTLCLGLSLASHTMALRGSPESSQPRVVATIIALEPRGMATIRTADGVTYSVVKGTAWHVGDTVECQPLDTMGVPKWLSLDCRKVS